VESRRGSIHAQIESLSRTRGILVQHRPRLQPSLRTSSICANLKANRHNRFMSHQAAGSPGQKLDLWYSAFSSRWDSKFASHWMTFEILNGGGDFGQLFKFEKLEFKVLWISPYKFETRFCIISKNAELGWSQRRRTSRTWRMFIHCSRKLVSFSASACVFKREGTIKNRWKLKKGA